MLESKGKSETQGEEFVWEKVVSIVFKQTLRRRPILSKLLKLQHIQLISAVTVVSSLSQTFGLSSYPLSLH